MPQIKHWKLLVSSLFICQVSGIIGSFFSISAIPQWYTTLDKPIFSPPNSVFGPVWIVLYTLMGIAFYKVLVSNVTNKKYAIRIFIVQLTLNALWSIIFFGLRSPLLAFIEIVLLWISILLTILAFYKIAKVAALLLTPYITWVSFAGLLNFYIWLLNN